MQVTETAGDADAGHVQWCVVYDSRSGAVIHVHQHIALSRKEACATEALASEAIEQAAKRHGSEFLCVAEPADDVPLDYNARYRVDLGSGHVLWEIQRRMMPKRPAAKQR